jgi:hypothetical protein
LAVHVHQLWVVVNRIGKIAHTGRFVVDAFGRHNFIPGPFKGLHQSPCAHGWIWLSAASKEGVEKIFEWRHASISPFSAHDGRFVSQKGSFLLTSGGDCFGPRRRPHPPLRHSINPLDQSGRLHGGG